MACEITGPQIARCDEEVYRGVPPVYCDNGRVTEQAFTPTKADDGCLSVARASLTTPQVVHERRIARNRKSAGVWAVTIAECDDLGLAVYEDKIVDADNPENDDDSHALVDFRQCAPEEIKIKATVLAAKANIRAARYVPPA